MKPSTVAGVLFSLVGNPDRKDPFIKDQANSNTYIVYICPESNDIYKVKTHTDIKLEKICRIFSVQWGVVCIGPELSPI